MKSQDSSSSSDREARVVSFPTARAAHRPPSKKAPPVENLAKYQGGHEDPSDYRHRMIVNAAAFIVVAILIGAGLWLVDTMASMRKNQDCVLSGRRGCTPVEVNSGRW